MYSISKVNVDKATKMQQKRHKIVSDQTGETLGQSKSFR